MRKRSRHQPWYRPSVKVIAVPRRALIRCKLLKQKKKLCDSRDLWVNNLISSEPIITATAWCERTSVFSQKKVTPRPLVNQTMDPTGKSVQRTGRPYEKDSLRMSRFSPIMASRIRCLTHKNTALLYHSIYAF